MAMVASVPAATISCRQASTWNTVSHRKDGQMAAGRSARRFASCSSRSATVWGRKIRVGTPELRTHYDNIKQMVKEKTGRAMQEKERERKGKNGKIIKVAGCSPIP